MHFCNVHEKKSVAAAPPLWFFKKTCRCRDAMHISDIY
jgi:hypothetical protein